MTTNEEFDDDFDPECRCHECGDGDIELLRSACCDDLCHGGEVPCEIHGDFSVLPCGLCGKVWA